MRALTFGLCFVHCSRAASLLCLLLSFWQSLSACPPLVGFSLFFAFCVWLCRFRKSHLLAVCFLLFTGVLCCFFWRFLHRPGLLYEVLRHSYTLRDTSR